MNRPRAVDFLNEPETEENFKNEPVEDLEENSTVLSEDNSKESDSGHEYELDKAEKSQDEDEEPSQESNTIASNVLPSGAISKDEEDYWSKKTRSGGAYIPPARLALMQRSIADRSSEAFQRVSWEALKKSINGLVNKVNVANLKDIAVELFRENLIRGRGLLVRACLKAQASALPFTPVYAALFSVLNTKLPDVGELALKRLVVQFRRSYRRNDKTQCLASVTFLAHLVNQRVAHEIVALQLLTLLLEQVTDDGVEIAVAFMKDCGAFLAEFSPKPSNAIFERFRTILHEGAIDKRVQYMIEVLFQIRKDKFKDLPAVREDLDLVEEEDQITHFISLDEEEIDTEEALNIFKADSEFLENEAAYEEIKREILGDEEENEAEEGVGEDSEQQPEAGAQAVAPSSTTPNVQAIADMTGTNLVNLRKTIYLTIMSSVDFEECGHKLLKVALPAGLETELTNMIVECCSQERSYLKFYGLLAERFAKLNPIWSDAFLVSFATVYSSVHRLETNKIRNVGKLFGHMLYTDALPWPAALSPIQLTEESTSSASRIFLKFLFQDLAESMGCPRLLARFYEPSLRNDFLGLFPEDGSRELRFSINFFTAVGLGPLTELMRERLREINERTMNEAEDGYAMENDVERAAERAGEEEGDVEVEVEESKRLDLARDRRELEDRESRHRRRSISPSRSRSRDRRHPSRHDSRSPSRERHYRSRHDSRSRSRDRRRTRSRSTSRDRHHHDNRYRSSHRNDRH